MSELLKINVSEHTEKKNGLTYLSWAWAWAEVLKLDPDATWDAVEFNGFPASFAPDGSALVKTIVTIKGKAKSCWLPVMNHRNQAIKNPDAFNINTAIVRCLTKCISMHGLGLYIYAGEDLPEEEVQLSKKEVKVMGGLHDIGEAELSEDWKTYLQDTAKLVVDLVAQGKFDEANFERYKEPLDDVQELYLERFLDSKTRSAIRKHNQTKG
jgi:hypothetical protein